MAFVDAYRKDTGKKVRIPEHWLTHRTLGVPFAKTPVQKARDAASAKTPASAGDAPKEKS